MLQSEAGGLGNKSKGKKAKDQEKLVIASSSSNLLANLWSIREAKSTKNKGGVAKPTKEKLGEATRQNGKFTFGYFYGVWAFRGLAYFMRQ